jgi:hypothetical protein
LQRLVRDCVGFVPEAISDRLYRFRAAFLETDKMRLALVLGLQVPSSLRREAVATLGLRLRSVYGNDG